MKKRWKWILPVVLPVVMFCFLRFVAVPGISILVFSIDKAIGVQPFLKRNISPFGLSHLLPYGSMAAFFDFPNEKIFSFQVEDFRPTARLNGAAPDRGMLVHGERRVTKTIAARSCRKNNGTPMALSKRYLENCGGF